MATAERWEPVWAQGVPQGTCFDTGSPHPHLAALIATPGALPPGRALVPGCGRGYAVAALARADRAAVGLDVAPTAVAAATAYLASPAARVAAGASATVRLGSFFELPSGAGDPKWQVIYDYTFLCAIPPALHARWAAQMAALLDRDAGVLLTMVFPICEQPKEGGPPYAMSLELVRGLLEGAGLEAAAGGAGAPRLLAPEESHAGRGGQPGGMPWGVSRTGFAMWRHKKRERNSEETT